MDNQPPEAREIEQVKHCKYAPAIWNISNLRSFDVIFIGELSLTPSQNMKNYGKIYQEHKELNR